MSDSWAEVRRLAKGQHGMVSRRQALACGLTDESVRHRLRTERWTRVYGGVYQTLPGDCTWEAKAAAALLAVWSGGYPVDAVLAGPSAARLHALTPREPANLHVAVPAGRHLTAPPGVLLARRSSFHLLVDPGSTFPWVTSPAATVIDCAASGSAEAALGWLADGVRSRRVSTSQLRAELLRRRRVRHGTLLREVLDDVTSGAESAAELAYVRRVERAHGLPQAIRQLPRNGGAQRHDNAYREFAYLVEVDGRLHGAWSARVRDGARDRQASAQGWLTDRVFWSDVGPGACITAAEIAGVLRARGWQGRPRPCQRPLCALRGGLSGSEPRQPTT